MADYDLVLSGGRLAIPTVGMVRADVAVKNGTIAAIGHRLDERSVEVEDVSGAWVFPGLVDPHVHLGNHFPFETDLATESLSAAAGGVTTMLTTFRRWQFSPTLDPYPSFVESAFRQLRDVPHVDWAAHATAPSNASNEDLEETYSRFGIQSVKTWLAYPDREHDPGGYLDHFLNLVRKFAAMSDRPLLMVHAEDVFISNEATRAIRADGGDDLAAWNQARPGFGEAAGVDEVCRIAERYQVPIYLPHISSKEAVEAVRYWKARGAPVTAESCPHHLVLRCTDAIGNVGKVNPPIRTSVDGEALWDGLLDGTISAIGTDHIVRPVELKEGSIWDAALGFPGMETMLPTILTELQRRSLPPSLLAEYCSAGPARAFGLYPKKGAISVGSDADFVVVDPSKTMTIDPNALHSAARHTPFEGRTVTAWPVLTLLRGNVVWRSGVGTIGKSSGRYIPIYPDSVVEAAER